MSVCRARPSALRVGARRPACAQLVSMAHQNGRHIADGLTWAAVTFVRGFFFAGKLPPLSVVPIKLESRR